MRFFSHDTRDSADDKPQQSDDEQAQTDGRVSNVQSNPVPVPQQRPPSPWAATPSREPDSDDVDEPAGHSSMYRPGMDGAGMSRVGTGSRGPDHDEADNVETDSTGTDSAETYRPDAERPDTHRAETDRADAEDFQSRRYVDDDSDGNGSPEPPDGHAPANATDAEDFDPDHPSRVDDQSEASAQDGRFVRDDGLPGLDTGQRQPFHEPAQPPTAFGASSVGGAVAASAVAGRQLDDDQQTDEGTSTSTNDRSEDATRQPADATDDRATDDRATADQARDTDDQAGGTADQPADRSDHTTDSTGAGQQWEAAMPSAGAGPSPATSGISVVDQPSSSNGAASAAQPGSTAEPTDAEPTDAEPTDAEPTDAEPAQAGSGAQATDAEPAPEDGASAAAVSAAASKDGADGVPPTEQLPGAVAAPQLGPLFADADAHAFRDRWRDVQLRFVDDPKAAADEAAALVDEAMETLSANLRRQKAQLLDAASVDGDTEQLRVRLRSYRDFLDRILGL